MPHGRLHTVQGISFGFTLHELGASPKLPAHMPLDRHPLLDLVTFQEHRQAMISGFGVATTSTRGEVTIRMGATGSHPQSLHCLTEKGVTASPSRAPSTA